MKQSYWLDRWQRDDIGFHQDLVNPYLLKYWHTLNVPAGSRVFVPLCGKTYDMVWLRNQELDVFGVEFSALAINAFYDENKMTPCCRPSPDGKFNHYSADHIDILCGDFFEMDKHDLSDISAVFDRASLVALPPETRRRYVNHLLNILPPATQILLISFDYPQSEMQGPPYAVPYKEITEQYQDEAEVHLLERIDVLEENPRFQERGLSRLQESVFLITLHDSKS